MALANRVQNARAFGAARKGVAAPARVSLRQGASSIRKIDSQEAIVFAKSQD